MSRSSGIAQALWMTALLGMWALPESAVAREPAPGDREPSYAAPGGCPSRQAWNDVLRARLPERLRHEVAGRRFTVQIESVPAAGAAQARYMGKLGSEAAGGEGRTVSGGSCREVADALTLIAALEMQRNAPIAAPLEASEPDATAEAGGRDVTEDTPPEVNGPRDPARLRVAAAGFALLQSTSAPRMTADLGVGVTLSWQTELFQPWLLLGAYWGDNAVQVRGGAAAAQFERWSTYVVGCPLRFPRRSAAGVRPCASVDLGRLRGEGQGVRLARESSSLLASAGLDLRLEWTVLERIELGALLGGVLTLSRPRFYFAPELTALDTAPVGLRTGATASVSF